VGRIASIAPTGAIVLKHSSAGTAGRSGVSTMKHRILARLGGSGAAAALMAGGGWLLVSAPAGAPTSAKAAPNSPAG
jgi:hypothetical protein